MPKSLPSWDAQLPDVSKPPRFSFLQLVRQRRHGLRAVIICIRSKPRDICILMKAAQDECQSGKGLKWRRT